MSAIERRLGWVPRVLARWLGGALIAVGILYVWLLYILTHHRCPGHGIVGARSIPGAGIHPPCGFKTARFFGYLGVSALAVLLVVGVWFAISRQVARRQTRMPLTKPARRTERLQAGPRGPGGTAEERVRG